MKNKKHFDIATFFILIVSIISISLSGFEYEKEAERLAIENKKISARVIALEGLLNTSQELYKELEEKLMFSETSYKVSHRKAERLEEELHKCGEEKIEPRALIIEGSGG